MPSIDPQITIQELTEKYPEVIDLLVIDYGFHCVGCFASQFETLIEGAAVHGIKDEDFHQLLIDIDKTISRI